LDYPGRVRSQITSVVCQIQRFDFDCILVLSRKLIIWTHPPLRLKPLYSIKQRPLPDPTEKSLRNFSSFSCVSVSPAGGWLQLYCPFALKWWVILVTHCHQKCVQKEISRSGFLDVNRYSEVLSIDLRRVFLRCVNISTRIFDGSVSCPGLYGGLYEYGQNLPYKFKNSYGDFWNRNFEKSHRTTGPRSDLRPDLWSWANSGLDSTFGNVETESFWVKTRGA
jgi:hypothetical protein